MKCNKVVKDAEGRNADESLLEMKLVDNLDGLKEE